MVRKRNGRFITPLCIGPLVDDRRFEILWQEREKGRPESPVVQQLEREKERKRELSKAARFFETGPC